MLRYIVLLVAVPVGVAADAPARRTEAAVVQWNSDTDVANCVFDSILATSFLAKASFQIMQSIVECPANQAGCTSEISKAINSFTATGSFLSAAASECGAVANANAQCAADVMGLVSAIAGIAGASSSLVNTCVEIGAGRARRLDHEGEEDEAQRRLYGQAPQILGKCIMNTFISTNLLGKAGLQITAATEACPNQDAHFVNGQAQCSADVSAVISSFATVAAFLSKAASQCAQTASITALCSGDASGLIASLAGVAASASGAANSCAAPPLLQPQLEALNNRAPDAFKPFLAQTIDLIQNKEPIHLSNKDFKNGTYILKEPGYYILDEDIIMAPDTPFMNPPLNSTTYPNSDGYWVGFFAAICLHTNDVIIDLNGHGITTSREFEMRNRFYSHIELANKPFLSGQGPPQMAKLRGELIPAERVVITNGKLGLSAHMGIHGNNNKGIWVDNVHAMDYESGGFQFNGANDIYITNSVLGPVLGAEGSTWQVPAAATLSQATVVLRIAHLLGVDDKEPEFIALRNSTEAYIRETLVTGTPPAHAIFNNATDGFDGHPDGSAVYGIVFHSIGVSVHEFAGCCSGVENTHELFHNFFVKNVTIQHLRLRVDELAAPFSPTASGGTMPVMGPGGDRVQIFRVADGQRYMKNVLTDAQEKMALLRDIAAADDPTLTDEELFAQFGLVNFPKALMKWTDGNITLDDAISEGGITFKCDEDSMGHVNKGAVGLRMEFLTNVHLEDITIKSLFNNGVRTKYLDKCFNKDKHYNGGDVRGVVATNVQGLNVVNGELPDVSVSDLTSVHGTAYKYWSGCETESSTCPFVQGRRLSGDNPNGPGEADVASGGIFAPDIAAQLMSANRGQLRRLSSVLV